MRVFENLSICWFLVVCKILLRLTKIKRRFGILKRRLISRKRRFDSDNTSYLEQKNYLLSLKRQRFCIRCLLFTFRKSPFARKLPKTQKKFHDLRLSHSYFIIRKIGLFNFVSLKKKNKSTIIREIYCTFAVSDKTAIYSRTKTQLN